MSTPTDLLRKAAAEIGYYAPNDPAPGSKYGRWEAEKLGIGWLAGPSTVVWWCAIFVSWVLDGIATLPGAPGYNCDAMRAAARKAGQGLGNVRDARPGDIVFFDWNHDGSLDHVGIVELNAGTYLQTIEGNTSSGTGGSQSAGNGVWRRTRDWSSVSDVVRPALNDVETVSNVLASVPAAPVPATPAPAGPVVIAPGVPAPPFPLPKGWYFGPKAGPVQSVSGYFSHREDFRRWQQRMKDRGWDINPDGLYGTQSAGVAHDFQVEKGLQVDSLIGPQTWGAAWTEPVTR